jgi:lipopolysaccharide export system protein LptA
VLEGPGAKVVSGKDEVVGSKITFYRDDGRVSMEGDGQNRVKAIIHSGQRGLN